MYCMAGQSSEEEMYNNESAGPALEEFLHLLGERVRLKGFTKYRAQLDTKSTYLDRNDVFLLYLADTFTASRTMAFRKPACVCAVEDYEAC